MNYTGERRAILTLAHELGHGLHGVLAQPLGLFNASTTLTAAETASVFGEALTFKKLLAAEDDPRRRLDLLTGRIEDAIATTFRQISMNRFEDAAHTERRSEGELAPTGSSELWIEAQSALFGDSVGVDGYDNWWSYIPHFASSPGYVYAYAYGYLFSLAIFRLYELEGDAMVEPYLELLRARRLALAGRAREGRRARSRRPRDLVVRASTRSPSSSTRPSGSPPRSASAG